MLVTRSERLYRNHPKGVKAVVLADRHVFADHESLGVEAVAGLVVLVAGDVVVEGPGAARSPDQVAVLMLLAGAEADHAAEGAVLLPGDRIDVVVFRERRDELVADLRAAGRVPGSRASSRRIRRKERGRVGC